MNKTNILLLYGLPCSGKSSVLSALNTNHHVITVDTIITKIIAEPSIEDFIHLSNDIIKAIIDEINNGKSNQYLIEVGCLISKSAIDLLEVFFVEKGYDFFNIKLIASDDELVKRIINRNTDITSGIRQGIKVDGPDYLTRFKQILEKNLPDNLIEIDTTTKPTENVILEIIKSTGVPFMAVDYSSGHIT